MSKRVEKSKKQKKGSRPKKKTATTKKTNPVKVETSAKVDQSGVVESEVTKEALQSTIEKLTFQLEQTNMQLDQFEHTTSHELQEPLRKIITFSKILQQSDKKLKKQEVKKYLEKIDSSSARLRKLIEQMLNFARVTNYEKLLLKTDLNKILKSTLFDLELLIEEKKAAVIAHELPEIEAVPFQMSQLFYDIIHNSLKFSKVDVAPIIEIASRKLTKKDMKLYANLDNTLLYYEITFKDNGIGFDQKYAEQIFTMFQRLSGAGEYPGTGIGLAICKKVVHTYHGEIFAEGLEDEGAVIHVLLPVAQPKKLPDDIPTILKTWV
ncbi:MAG: ATP-binding protein [Ferruginibacter sp.]